jgi:hypothetical protein
MKKTPYITNLPTLIQIVSTMFTYKENILGIEIIYKSNKMMTQILIKILILSIFSSFLGSE